MIISGSPSHPSRSRRRALRRAVEVPVELISSHIDQPVLHWAADLTPFGLWIDTRFPLARGEHVVLCFEPTVWSLEPMTVFARVTRSRRARDQTRAGMGLCFLDLSSRERQALAGWLRGRPPSLPREPVERQHRAA